jgi:hypothetical protein
MKINQLKKDDYVAGIRNACKQKKFSGEIKE